MSNFLNKKNNYKKYVVDSKLRYFKPHATKVEKSFAEEITSSLTQNSKFINPKFFYDKKGSDLFELICLLPEYYLTRTEISILKNFQSSISLYVDMNTNLVELGSGSSVKTRLILDILTKLQPKTEYFPIDISEILTESSEQLLNDYDTLHITGIVDSYERGLEFLKNYDDKKNLILFLGSSFGNFTPDIGKLFLDNIFSTMKSGDLFLIGLDLVKDNNILESAYDDSQGITSKFNLNVLSRINDELDADFNIDNFSHYSLYNETEQRIEMNLRSLVSQSVIIGKSNMSLNFNQDELIHTEYSHKYHISQIEKLLIDVGFEIKNMWLDDKKYFSLTLVSKN
ncbi:MAG: L-histidine N(alpha)-methyltransferase [Candidatus Nitrosopumilus limneticus]|nr:L-histidine N(Alpha)-methyltransferase [Candidatus Nitrosopumilus limneticus]MDC4212664.1 L-histidine N(alpha)-methyltransferase [Candidatus Nitrosopumilus limneticus]MDC4213432.1 L-histidine N(alpha)-methyltransferase [Candidatus Nitrosopumilus limneticus]MDC4214292.1 L-histidine N(alpha)-methyltransferase [Candidatus Nitrosopumilus limneticus]MDC4215465.1 L-histidine N(alpha)-methyltransferase [Candidatus Nitrosopumilus limneticus]